MTSSNLFLFQLGREAPIALAELHAVLGVNAKFITGSPRTAVFELPPTTEASQLQERLAGIVKIGRLLAELPHSHGQKELTEWLVRDLSDRPSRDFGLSLIDSPLKTRYRDELGLAVKKQLKERGRGARFVASKEIELPSALVRDQLLAKGREYLLAWTPKRVVIAETVTIQDFVGWSFRDYERPARDPRRGMLPPKLARAMVNLLEADLKTPLFDPFCGVGTVLMEAALLGYTRLAGSDQDERAVAATRENWTWLNERFPQLAQVSIDLRVSSVEKLPDDIMFGAMVSEADLGPPDLVRLSNGPRVDRFTQLAPRYQAWLKRFYELTPSGGRLLLAFPILLSPRTELPIPDFAEQIGWQTVPFFPTDWLAHPALKSQPNSLLTYARADQIIGRQLIRLQK